MRFIIFLTITILLSWTGSCSGTADNKRSKSSETSESVVPADQQKEIITLASPAENAEMKLHSGFNVVLSIESKDNIPDSVRVWFDSHPVKLLKSAPWELQIPASMVSRTGRKALKVVAFKGGDAIQTITRFLITYSDTPPGRNGYRVIKEFPHDNGAFTQGLVYYNGLLYEGTGQETRSSLRKVKLETGEVLKQLNLDPEFFGEGIAILGEKIFQVTWRSNVGFVYNLEDFSLINKVYYQTEGWGLTTMGDRLVMSDGTNILYFIEPGSFTVISTVEVYDNREKVSELNELEYINGEIWANIWQKDLIARIDPESGKVIAYIDLKGILKDPGTDIRPNELNGIAWDGASSRIFITGKNWPKLFQIALTE